MKNIDITALLSRTGTYIFGMIETQRKADMVPQTTVRGWAQSLSRAHSACIAISRFLKHDARGAWEERDRSRGLLWRSSSSSRKRSRLSFRRQFPRFQLGFLLLCRGIKIQPFIQPFIQLPNEHAIMGTNSAAQHHKRLISSRTITHHHIHERSPVTRTGRAQQSFLAALAF